MDEEQEPSHPQRRASDRQQTKFYFQTDMLAKLVISVIVIIACFSGEFYVLFMATDIPENAQMIVGRVLGTMDSLLVGVVFYWVGSSSGSAIKDQVAATKT